MNNEQTEVYEFFLYFFHKENEKNKWKRTSQKKNKILSLW